MLSSLSITQNLVPGDKIGAMKAIHLSILVLLTVSLSVACSHRDQTPENKSHFGAYTLVEVDGHAIPAEVSHGQTLIRVESGRIEFEAGGTCISQTVFGPPEGENIHREVRADCVYKGHSVDLTWHGAGRTRGQFGPDDFTMNNEGMIFRYRKIEDK